MVLYCGLDCGGTKTLCVLADENGKILGTGRGGPSNYLSCPREIARNSILESVVKAFSHASILPRHIDYAFVASASIEVHRGEKHLPFLASCLDAEHLYADSDTIPVWFASAGKDPAIVTISGTGSVTYAFQGDHFIKAGGWGPWLGDEGSGYDIGRRLINAASRQYDGREENKEVLEAVCKHFGIEDFHLIHSVLGKGDKLSLTASAAQCACKLYCSGNQTAAEILRNAAKELTLAIRTVIKGAGFEAPVPLILSGSLLKPQQPLYNLLMENITGEKHIARVCVPEIPAAAAAAAMLLHWNGRQEACGKLLAEYREEAS